MQLSPQSSPIPLAFLWYNFNPEIMTGSPGRGCRTRVGLGKQAISSFMRVAISKTVRDMTKVTAND